MKILLQVALVFGIYWVSQGIEAVLPVAFPASVISLLLLLVLLLTGIVKMDHVREKSDFLLGNLGFFFIPVSVSIINYVDLIWQNAAAFLTVCVVSMVLTYGATVWAVRCLKTRRRLSADIALPRVETNRAPPRRFPRRTGRASWM